VPLPISFTVSNGIKFSSGGIELPCDHPQVP
jgi:hypothetical protein